MHTNKTPVASFLHIENPYKKDFATALRETIRHQTPEQNMCTLQGTVSVLDQIEENLDAKTEVERLCDPTVERLTELKEQAHNVCMLAASRIYDDMLRRRYTLSEMETLASCLMGRLQKRDEYATDIETIKELLSWTRMDISNRKNFLQEATKTPPCGLN